MAALRMRLLEAHPFWGYLLMQVQLVANEQLPSFAATDCLRHIWYNPRLTCHLDLAQLGFVLAHELGHHVQASLERERGRDHHLWNCATDYAINRLVAAMEDPAVLYPRQALYRAPSGNVPGLGPVEILLDARFDGMIAERIYDVLDQDAAGAGGGSRLVDVDLGQGARFPALADHGGGIDVHLPGELSRPAREQMGDRLRAALEHWRAAESRGQVPGSVLRAFNVDANRVPWARVLRQYVSAARATAELDPRRPHRRWLEAGAVVPSWGGSAPGLVVVALDTSGSMSAAQLSAMCAEVRALARELDDLLLLVADADVQASVPLDQLERWLAARAAPGGGGTSHVPVFDWIREKRLEPALFVGLTDLFSAFPRRPPPFPVLWVAPPGHGPAPWGRVLEVR